MNQINKLVWVNVEPTFENQLFLKDLSGPVSRNSPKLFAVVKLSYYIPHSFKSSTLQFTFFYAILLYAFVH